jgi:hypothetical protein
MSISEISPSPYLNVISLSGVVLNIAADNTNLYAVSAGTLQVFNLANPTITNYYLNSNLTAFNPMRSDNTYLYIGDQTNNVIYRYDQSGNMTLSGSLASPRFLYNYTYNSNNYLFGFVNSSKNLFKISNPHSSLSSTITALPLVNNMSSVSYLQGAQYAFIRDTQNILYKLNVDTLSIDASYNTTIAVISSIVSDPNNNALWAYSPAPSTNKALIKYSYNDSGFYFDTSYNIPASLNPSSFTLDNLNIWFVDLTGPNYNYGFINKVNGTIKTYSPGLPLAGVSRTTVLYTSATNRLWSFYGGINGKFISYFTDIVSCYNKGTKILILENDNEVYRNVEDLKVGDFVKIYSNPNVQTYPKYYKPIILLGSSSLKNDPIDVDRCMYIITKEKDSNLLEDLIITSNHRIVTDSTENFSSVIDGLNMVVAKESEKAQKINDENIYNYYHFVLGDKESIDKHYCVNANGILSESLSEKLYKKYY